MNDGIVHIQLKKAEPLKVGGKVYRSAYDWELTKKDLEKAALELGETEEKKTDCLRKLKEKISKDSNIKYPQDDVYLLPFLRVRKYDVKKAYDNVKLLSEERKKNSDFYILQEDLKSVQELNFCQVLPYTNEEGTIMLLMNFKKWDPTEKTFEEIIQTGTNVCDIVIMNPHCQINGVIGIWNLDGMTVRHVSELLWNNRLWRTISLMQSAAPWRIKKVIMLNTNRFVRLLFNMVKPLLKRKIAERVFLLGSDVTELHQHVNPILLPESLKGTLKDETCDVSQHVLENLPYLKYERSFISQ